jgi:hypothetical protein
MDCQIEHYNIPSAFDLFRKHLYGYFLEMPNKTRLMMSLFACKSQETFDAVLDQWLLNLSKFH